MCLCRSVIASICACRWMSDSMLEDITADIIRQYPNTYTFTKAIAERLLLDERGHVPSVIFRPSIVTASLKEPISVGVFIFTFCEIIFVPVVFVNNNMGTDHYAQCCRLCLSMLLICQMLYSNSGQSLQWR